MRSSCRCPPGKRPRAAKRPDPPASLRPRHVPVISLFLTDIDGCLSEPYCALDLEAMAQLRAWSEAADADPAMPRLGICSGRSYGYVEALVQALGWRGPALFESGAGRFYLEGGRVHWNEALTEELEDQLDAVRKFFRRELIPRGGFNMDYGKRAQASIVTLDPDALTRAIEGTEALIACRFPDLFVAPTHVSIDVLPRVLNKRVGVEELARHEGLSLCEIAFVGDTRGDIGALEAVGFSFAPANAQPEVLHAVDIVTEGAVLAGVIEAYRWCVAHNRARLRAA
jgi:hydroxymethylpyrimidine pyrophosphatase-like HAD family hydrolase